jgi:DNA-binding LytR/AlgR family response regulator
MRKTNLLIVEDDMDFAERISEILTKLDCQFSKVNYKDALLFEKSLKGSTKVDFDIVVMPIEASENNALVHFFKSEQLPVLFLSDVNSTNTLAEKDNHTIFGYVLEPIVASNLGSSLENVLRKLGDNKTTEQTEATLIVGSNLFVKKKNLLCKIPVKSITYIESDKNYCTVVANQEKYVLKISLSKFIQHFSKQEFLQVHKRYVVQIDEIETIDLTNLVIQLPSITLPIGRVYKNQLIDALKVIS